MKKKLLGLVLLLALLVTVVPIGAQDDEDEVEFTIYVTDDVAYSTALLEGWVAQGSREDGIQIANSEEMMAWVNSEEKTLVPAGGYAIVIAAIPEADLGMGELDAQTFTALILEFDEEFSFGEVSAFEFEDYEEAARAEASTEFADLTAVSFEIAPDAWAFAVLAAAPGEGADGEALGLAVLNSATFGLPLEESVEGASGATYHLPTGWIGSESESEGQFIFGATSSDIAADAMEFEEGQFGVILMSYDGDDTYDTALAILPAMMEEGQTATPPFYVNVGDQEVLVMTIEDEEEDSVGGIMVLDSPEGEPDRVAWFGSAPGEAEWIALTVLNILVNGVETMSAE